MKAALLGLGLLVTGCGAAPRVTRVYDGRVVEGRYVSPPAYAAFLKGALAEADGDLPTARRAFEAVTDDDGEDPLAWARLGGVLCKQGDAKGAARAFAKARAADPAYAGALGAEAACALAKGDPSAASLAAAATAADPASVDLGALAVRASARRPAAPDDRARALALTAQHGEREVAWDALVAWAEVRGDEELLVRGLVGLAALSPVRLPEIEARALALVTRDRVAAARTVAAALADAPRERGHRGPRDAVVARLAVDEAITRGDDAALRRRAARGHVLLVEAAARAVALEKSALGQDLARELAAADPDALGPRLVLAAAAPALQLPKAAGQGTRDVPPALCVYLVATRLEASSGAAAARDWVAATLHAPPPPRDPLAAAFAARLAARGALPPAPPKVSLRDGSRARRAAARRVTFGG